MELLTILTWICRAAGFISWAEALEKQYAINKKAREVSNAPQTKAEELDFWDKSGY